MRIVCRQTTLRLMKYHTLFFFRKLRKMSENLSSAAVMVGALMVYYPLWDDESVTLEPVWTCKATLLNRAQVSYNQNCLGQFREIPWNQTAVILLAF